MYKASILVPIIHTFKFKSKFMKTMLTRIILLLKPSLGFDGEEFISQKRNKRLEECAYY